MTITDYQTLPEGKTCSTSPGRATCSAPRSTTCRRASRPTSCRTGRRSENGVVQNDFLCIGRAAKSPVLAHHFLNYVLDEKNAYSNFVDFTGYTPPQNAIDADVADQARA